MKLYVCFNFINLTLYTKKKTSQKSTIKPINTCIVSILTKQGFFSNICFIFKYLKFLCFLFFFSAGHWFKGASQNTLLFYFKPGAFFDYLKFFLTWAIWTPLSPSKRYLGAYSSKGAKGTIKSKGAAVRNEAITLNLL